MSGTRKRERPRGIEAGSPDEKGERGIGWGGGVSGKIPRHLPLRRDDDDEI